MLGRKRSERDFRCSSFWEVKGPVINLPLWISGVCSHVPPHPKLAGWVIPHTICVFSIQAFYAVYRLNADSDSCTGLAVRSNPWVLISWGFELNSVALGKILPSHELHLIRKMGIIKSARETCFSVWKNRVIIEWGWDPSEVFVCKN